MDKDSGKPGKIFSRTGNYRLVFFSRPQMYMETDELLTRIHLRYFGGEKVLMLMEPTEKEEAFFFYENGLMIRQRGYYIYYEKILSCRNT